MIEQMYLRDSNDFALMQSAVKIQLSTPEEYPIWLLFRYGNGIYGQVFRRYYDNDYRNITESVLNGTYKFIDYSLLADFVNGQGTSWDLPLDGFAVIVCEDADVLNVFREHGIITLNLRDARRPYLASKWVVEQHSTKYDAYKYTINGEIFGAQLWDGSYSWKRLRLHTFLRKRISDEKKLQQLQDKLNLLSEFYKEEYFSIENSLINGYDETPVDSCMKGYGEYFNNFEDAGVLLKYSNNTDGRAIIWSDQFIKGLPEGCQGFMDRIYPSNNHNVVEAFKSYAKAHNLLYKAEQSYDAKERFVFNDQVMTLSLTLRPPNAGRSKRYPYMDTFTYTDDFRSFSNNSGYIELTDTSGGTSQNEVCCCNCDCTVHEDDVYHDVNGDSWCPDCFYKYHSACSCCSEYYSNDDLHESDDGDICEDCISRRYYKYCEDIEMYSQDWVRVNTGDYYYSTDGLYYAEDTAEWYDSSDSLTMTYDTEEWYASTDSLHFAVDVEAYYADEDNLVLTVDTNRYFTGTGGLFKYNDEWYEKEQ